MDRAEAIHKVIEPDASYDYPHALVDSLVALGLLKLDGPPQTLWELLRKHGVPLDRAQAICNDAMLRGVTIPIDGPRIPQVTTTQENGNG